jgi:sugar lactone lactonase YvrE
MTRLSRIEPLEPVLGRPHGLLEAPRFATDGEVIYSDVLAGGVWGCASDGTVREILPKRRGIGGILAHADGGWVISGRNVVHLQPDGGQREVLSGDGVCGYNDLGTTPTGALLAGVLRFQPFAGEEPCPGMLLRVDPGGVVETLTEDILWPNGIGVAPGGETVYISDYARGMVLAVPERGGEARELCRSPRGSADGLAVDREGGVWVALGDGGGIARFHGDGQLDEVTDLPAAFVSSLSFGGPDMCDVLITTADNQLSPELGGTVFRARSEVAGVALAPVSV